MSFKRFIAIRLLTMVFIVFVLLTFIFFAIHIIPGDPVEAMVGESASQETIENLRHELGLDKPLLMQYFDYIFGVFTGDLGDSIILRESVASMILDRAGVTVQLAVMAWIVSVIFGIGIGRYSAYKEGKIQDHAIRSGTLFIYAIPVYVLGIALQLIFGVYLNILPIFGTNSPLVRPPKVTGMILVDTLLVGDLYGFTDSLTHFILPVLSLAAYYVAVTVRITRSETVKARKRTYCLLAQAKGLDEKTITTKHAFRNALLPVATIIGLQAGTLLTGSILTETVFSFHGLGNLIFIAASQRDFILTQGVVTVFVLITSVIGMIIDISYYFLDPRVRF
ncbi:MAG: ABC transporter permease [Candidatus Hodarchaeales archaeon]|jgi:peptide/nickel transport system permease protein